MYSSTHHFNPTHPGPVSIDLIHCVDDGLEPPVRQGHEVGPRHGVPPTGLGVAKVGQRGGVVHLVPDISIIIVRISHRSQIIKVPIQPFHT